MNILEMVLYFRYYPSVVSEANSTVTGEQHTWSLGKVRREANVSLDSCLEKWPFKTRPEWIVHHFLYFCYSEFTKGFVKQDSERNG